MNGLSCHINFLNPSEINYDIPLFHTPIFKRVVISVFFVIILQAAAQYIYLGSIIRRGTELEQQWDAIKPEVETVSQLKIDQKRYAQGTETLEGWKKSRYNWSQFLAALADEIPGDPKNTQWTRIQFDENIEGLRHQIPGESRGNFFPLKRQIQFNMTGVVKSDHPVARLLEFKRNAMSGVQSLLMIQNMKLDYYNFLLDKERKRTDLTHFSYTIDFSPREMKP